MDSDLTPPHRRDTEDPRGQACIITRRVTEGTPLNLLIYLIAGHIL